jgi:tellurite methyltransferase
LSVIYTAAGVLSFISANMDLRGWDQRYRERTEVGAATPLLIDVVSGVRPGRALDLACGSGRNALWLADHGWRVTAVDGSPAAIEIVTARNPSIGVFAADLENHEYIIQPDSWDLIVFSYYLQRDLFEPAKRGVVPGGMVLAIVHIPGPGEPLTRFRLNPGELAGAFQDFEILHSYEGPSRDPEHRQLVAEIAARRIK